MGKVKYATGIEYVQGSLAKPKKRNGHSCGDYLIGTHRSAPTQNPDCTRLYIHAADTYVRSTQPGKDELDNRSRFAAVSAMVKARKKDLAHIADDQAAFMAQKDSPNGKTTMKAYLWKVCGDAYDEAQANSGD